MSYSPNLSDSDEYRDGNAEAWEQFYKDLPTQPATDNGFLDSGVDPNSAEEIDAETFAEIALKLNKVCTKNLSQSDNASLLD